MSILDTSTRIYYRTAPLPLSALGELALSCARLASFLRVFLSVLALAHFRGGVRVRVRGGEELSRWRSMPFHPRKARRSADRIISVWGHTKTFFSAVAKRPISIFISVIPRVLDARLRYCFCKTPELGSYLGHSARGRCTTSILLLQNA